MFFYLLSAVLDAFDGQAARYFNQSTKFGSVLDMVTDRSTTTCLLVHLAIQNPNYALVFQLLISLDFSSHYMHMYAQIHSGAESHKNISKSSNKLLHLYYTNSNVLFGVCAGISVEINFNASNTNVDIQTDTLEDALMNLSNDLILDKIFQTVLKPSKLDYYHFKMSENPEISDVTMTGSVSIDMLDNLLVCLNNYKGPLSITLHINDDNNLQLNLDTVKSFLNNNFAVLKKQLDLHLIIDNFPHQHNYFANVAAFFSRTDLILPMDFNFISSTDFSLNKYEGVLSKLMDQNNKVLYIIPSFEKVQSENAWELTSQFPHSKKGLMEENRYQIYGGSDNRAHISTNYSEWYLANNPYLTASISFFYEPFAVFNKHVVPWMDERFIGSNGGGRSAWFYEITLSGFEFWVLNDDFLIFSNTPTSLANVNNELKNKTFWGFLPEICNRHRVRLWESEKKEIDLMGCRPGPNSRF